MDALLILCEFLLREEENKSLRRQQLRMLRDSQNPFEEAEKVFKAHFRLTKFVAKNLIEELEPFNTQSSNIPFHLRVLSTLYFLGHGSYQKCIAASYFLPKGQPTISRNIEYICKMITSKLAYRIMFCTTIEEKSKVKEGFFTKFNMKGVVGAIDCTHIGIISTPIYNSDRAARLYMNRKGFYSINVEAVVDSDLKFMALNAKFPGSCHDSAIWITSPVRVHLIQTNNPRACNWLIGDSGYPLEPWPLTPISTPQTYKEELFNKMQIKARNTAERAFEVVKARFRCLHKHRTLHYSPHKTAMVIYSCAILHNILIDNSVVIDDLDDIIEYDETDENIENLNTMGHNYLRGAPH